MLRITSLNLNGIRPAAGKGFFDCLAAQSADYVCVQELKAQLPDLSPTMQSTRNLQADVTQSLATLQLDLMR